MAKTKGELVSAALNELGIADYEFDISPDELETGVRRLDSMMAQWSAIGAVLNYPFGELDSATDSGIPDVAEEAVITNLAIRLASSYGKQPDPILLGTARTSKTVLLSFSTRPREIRFPQMPRGAGHKNHEWPFTTVEKNPYVDVVDNDVDLSGGPDGGT